VNDNIKAFFVLPKEKVCDQHIEQPKVGKTGAGLAWAAIAIALASGGAEVFAEVLVHVL
jgi:hypothetical protein